MQLRTDLAVEAREIAREDIKDVEYKSEEVQGMVIERLSVRTDRAAQLMGKDAGRYVTVNLPPLTDNIRDTDVRILL